MQKYIKNYCEYFNIGEQDIVYCEVCGSNRGVDVHHVEKRSLCGDDSIENLIGVCRPCHDKAHYKKQPYLTVKQLKDIICQRH